MFYVLHNWKMLFVVFSSWNSQVMLIYNAHCYYPFAYKRFKGKLMKKKFKKLKRISCCQKSVHPSCILFLISVFLVHIEITLKFFLFILLCCCLQKFVSCHHWSNCLNLLSCFFLFVVHILISLIELLSQIKIRLCKLKLFGVIWNKCVVLFDLIAICFFYYMQIIFFYLFLLFVFVIRVCYSFLLFVICFFVFCWYIFRT